MELPFALWGLDPLFKSYVKLLISQIHSLDSFENLRGTWKLFCHPISRVDIVGYLVAFKIKNTMVRFTVDDGSGVIVCPWWYQRVEQMPMHDTQDIQWKVMAQNQALALNEQWVARGCAARGQLVRIRGKLKPPKFTNRCEISVHTLDVLDNIDEEALHWLEVMRLTKHVYPFPSRNIDECLKINEVSEARVNNPMVLAIEAYLKRSKIVLFTVRDLTRIKSLCGVAGTSATTETSAVTTSSPLTGAQVLPFLSALGEMVKTGLLVKSTTTEFYEVISMEDHLVPQIVAFLSRHLEGPIAHIWEHVRLAYPCVLVSAVRASLDLLVAQGLVVEAAPDVFRFKTDPP